MNSVPASSLPIGADPMPAGGVAFRVWAPRRTRVEVVLESDASSPRRDGHLRARELEPEADGYFAGFVREAGVGTLYRYRLDQEEKLYPDPASRFQPEGPHGPSRVVDPGSFAWTDGGWEGPGLEGQVVYEMHIGTFTPEGTWSAATAELPKLADLGVSLLEIMPVAEFPGRFGWGYDGVDLFAPTRLYGEPDDFRRFVDGAHRHGLGVILDVVYNHLGPAGNYLGAFSSDYFSDRYDNEWGDALNFDGPNSGPVRDFFVANAEYWIREFHLDGLRLDATQQIFDSSTDHILAAISRRVRSAAGRRRTLLIAENEPQHVRLIRSEEAGGYGLDAIWNDDFHHAARVAVTGRAEAYYSDFNGSPQELASAARFGFLFQGQHYRWQGQPRGSSTHGLPRQAFVNYLQNHDQVANSASGARLHQQTSPGRYRAITSLLLLAPGTPMLFQGQEFAATAPFLYFADHEPELAEAVRRGRADFLSQFPSIGAGGGGAHLAEPSDPETFARCKLDLAEREEHGWAWTLHRDLLRLRREDAVLRRQGDGGLDAAVLADGAFVLRYRGDAEDRILLVNLGRDLLLRIAPEPLLAPPPGGEWELYWSSEHPKYGGGGTPPVETEEGWYLAGEASLLLGAETRHPPPLPFRVERRAGGRFRRGRPGA
jgi:maltooligosyltrehalose trehalohydrolase